jgi:hypothetical protein
VTIEALENNVRLPSTALGPGKPDTAPATTPRAAATIAAVTPHLSKYWKL